MINTKKVNAVILALVIALSVCVPAFAANSVTVIYDASGKIAGYMCDTCDTVYSTKAEAEACTLEKASVYTCPTCGKKYDTLAGYNACIDSHTNTSGYLANYYTCPNCGEMFETIGEYNTHQEEKHSNNAINTHYDKYVVYTIPQIIDVLFGYFQTLYGYFVDTGFNDIMYSNASTFFEALTTYIIQAAGLVSGTTTTTEVA